MRIVLILLMVALIGNTANAQAPAKTVAANNAMPGKPTSKQSSSLLTGTYSAPVGINIVLQNNGSNDLTLMAGKENERTFSTTNFKFPNPVADGSKYRIQTKKIPAGQTCVIYSGAEGTMPQSGSMIRIGVDYTYDLVSRSSDDRSFSTFYESADVAVGGNPGEEGRYLTFISSAKFSGSSGKHRQIFWRDRNTGVTKLISVGLNGEDANGDCYAPSISGDGLSVAFESFATNLVADDKNGFKDVFVWNSTSNKLERVGLGKNGKEADAESYEPSVSGDGNLIAFTSAASNISTTEKGVSNNNVYLFDRLTKSTIMISIDPVSRKGGGGSKPSISYEGKRIAFYSHTATLVPDDKNGIWDIFLWEKDNPALKRVTLTFDGKERGQGSESANRIVAPAISGNGRYIAFTTTANDMVSGDINGYQDVFVYDINTGTTVIASNGPKGQAGNGDSPIEQGEKIAISFDGNWVSFTTKASNIGVPASNIVLHNLATGEKRAVSAVTGSTVGRPVISYGGGYVIFGIGGKLDNRFSSSGIFANYTGVGPCRSCPE